MYPPPPMLPASGYTTASAKPTATAASTALPPWRMISMPASPASGASLATIACVPKTGRCPALKGHAAGKTAGRRSTVYSAAPRSCARLGEPMSVAEGGGVCAVRQPRIPVATQAPRHNTLFFIMSESESRAESQDELAAQRALASGDAGTLVHRDKPLLHKRDLHVTGEGVAKAVADAAGEIGVELSRRQLLAGDACAKCRVSGGAKGDVDDLVEANTAAPRVKGRHQLRHRRVGIA